MRFYGEIFKKEGLPRCMLTPLGGGYFEGVKAVGEFSAERIILCFPKLEVEVLGRGLEIAKYYDGDLQIEGKIVSVTALVGEKQG